MKKSDAGNNNPGKVSRFLRRNTMIKVVSLLFGVLLWSYVLNVENPLREKTIRDVEVTFINEDLLTRNGLIVRGDKEELLKNVTVTASVPARMYGEVTNENIMVVVDLKNINSAGQYTLRKTATAMCRTSPWSRSRPPTSIWRSTCSRRLLCLVEVQI